MTVRTDALAAVDNEWRRASEINKRGDHWNARSTRDALVGLAMDGTIERRTVPLPGSNVVHEYRLPQKEIAS
jgi:hypothetical protein